MVSKESKDGPKENPKPDETDHVGSEKEKGPENSARQGSHQFNSSAHVSLFVLFFAAPVARTLKNNLSQNFGG